MAKDGSEIPKSRTSSLLSMAAKVALKEGKNLFQSQAEKRLAKMVSQADIIVDHVGRLKGAAMKAVQMITIEAQDILPPEVLQVLEKLQSQAPPFSNAKLLQCLKDELGPEFYESIEELSERPIASASIGQVYEAVINDEPVIIKIQYPGISESVDSDLKTLKKLIRTLLFVYGKEINIDELFEEVLRVLKLETNYLNEAESAELYKKNFSGSENYLVPSVHKRYSTEKVLTLTKMDGLEFTQWLKTNPSDESKKTVASHLLNLYIEEFFTHRLVQTDPNPANFLINSKNQLVLLDFGATVSYPEEFVKDYQDLIKTVFSGDAKDIIQKFTDLNFISHKESLETKQKFLDFLQLSLRPFDENQQPFNFAEGEYSNEVRRMAFAFTRDIKYSAPPKQIIFLHRKLGGIFLLLKKLEVQADLRKYRQWILGEQ